MRKLVVLSIQISILIIFSINFSLGQRSFQYDPEWPHESIPNLTLHGSAVVPDFENNLLILHRGSQFANETARNETIKEGVVVVIDQETGKMLRQWGEDFFYHPHGIEAASNGDIFVTDSRLHQVFKFSYIPETKLWNDTPIMTLGERLVPGTDRYHFDIPADVAIEPDTENFYVADGYGNKRVVKFDRCGNYILEFSAGSSGNAPIIQFDIVHKLTVAVRHVPVANRAVRRGADNQDVVVAVADRDNCRIQYFNGNNGSFLYEQTHEHLGIPRTLLMSVAHVDVNSRDEPYNSNFPAEFGIVYAVDSGSNTAAPRVLEIAVGWTNASIIHDFSTNNTYPYVRRGVSHDLTVSKDGGQVYVVISNSSTLIVKKFNMIVPSSALRNVCVSSLFVFLMAYLSTLLSQ